jgi:putative transposase
MSNKDWDQINDRELEAWRKRIALVETLLDESIDYNERVEVRDAYVREHGVTERTIRNYLKRYRESGAHGLCFSQGSGGVHSPRIHHPELAARILVLIREQPRRTVPQLRRLLHNDPDYTQTIAMYSDRTIYRFLDENGLSAAQRCIQLHYGPRRSFHQFQATASMQLVQGDARDGIWLPDGDSGKSRKTYLFALIDDYSRRILSAQYFYDEKLPRMEATFKTMVLRWGIPEKVYLDNGSVYIARQFACILSELKTRKIHHPPYQAWAKGKIESLMKTILNEFQSEAQQAGFQTLDELNSALWAWIDVEYNRRNHSSTGEPPAKRFSEGLPEGHRRIQDLEWFEALFLLRERRTVSKYGVIKPGGNQYRTQARHGTVIEVRYNPFEMRSVWRFEDGRSVETLVPHKVSNEQLPRMIEEQAAMPAAVSAAASNYFTTLRERQALLRKNADVPRYDKLIAEARS